MADAFGDAFAQDIGGAWTANVPRQKGELVLFNLDLACEGGALSGRGHQLFNGQTWHFSISAGTLQEDRVSLTLDFGSGDTEDSEIVLPILDLTPIPVAVGIPEEFLVTN